MGVEVIVLEKANLFKFFVANGDMDHAQEFFPLGGSQARAVDNPVIITTAVEAILLAQTVGKHLCLVIHLPWDQVGLLLGGSFPSYCCCCRHFCRCGSLSFLREGDATCLK
jgi:hypothetical protein